MFNKLGSKLLLKKQQNHIYKTMEHICDDCHRTGLVVRQISILNLAFWLLLGIIVGIVTSSFGYGFLTWFLCTMINVFLVKPTCRYCHSKNVRLPKDDEELQYYKKLEQEQKENHKNSNEK